MFFHRHRLASQRRLVDEQILALEDAYVGGHHVAGGQVNNVARHQLGGWQLADNGRLWVQLDIKSVDDFLGDAQSFVLALHAGCCAHHLTQFFGGVARAVFLHERQQSAEHHHQADHHGGRAIAHRSRNAGNGQEQQINGADEMLGELFQP